jgi:N-methylhydantoinase A
MNEVSLDWESGRLAAAEVEALRGAFERLYQQKFGAGTTHKKSALELISFRAEAVKEIPKPVIAPVFAASKEQNAQALRPIAKRRVYQHGRGWLEADIYDFDRLAPGHAYRGPAVIERQSTTVWLPPGSAAVLDVYGNIAIEPEG